MADQEIVWESLTPGWKNQSDETSSRKIWSSLGRVHKERVGFLESLKPEEWFCAWYQDKLLFLIAIFKDYIIVMPTEQNGVLYYLKSAQWRQVFYLSPNINRLRSYKHIFNDSKWRIKVRELLGKG